MPYHTFTVSWPPEALRPNGGKKHWRQVATAKAAYKLEAWGEAMASGIRGAEKAHIHFTFHPHKRGSMPDMDNCIASQKAVQDGIADALKMNDRDITVTYAMSQDRRACVVINVSTNDAAEIPLKGCIS